MVMSALEEKGACRCKFLVSGSVYLNQNNANLQNTLSAMTEINEELRKLNVDMDRNTKRCGLPRRGFLNLPLGHEQVGQGALDCRLLQKASAARGCIPGVVDAMPMRKCTRA